MVALSGFPMISQLTPITSDGKPSENAQQDCVAASIDAVCRYLLNDPENSVFNPDHFKDEAYGDAYRGGTSADHYVEFCKSLGIHLYPVDAPTQVQPHIAHQLLAEGHPVIFTEIDPYVDTSLLQYNGWTHVCVWYADDAQGLTAMDPWIARPIYKTDGSWLNVVRGWQLWTAERIEDMNSIPAGWHDDGAILTAPNGVAVRDGFRAYALAHAWSADNLPLAEEYHTDTLEISNQALGAGNQQLFRYAMLGWTPQHGVIFEWLGQELLACRTKLRDYAARLQQAQGQSESPQEHAALLQMVEQGATALGKHLV